MKRRQIVKKLLKAIEDGQPSIIVVPWFEQPITVVDIECLDWVNDEGQHITGRGVAKVCHPDPWKESIGQEIAMAKAVRNLVKNLFEAPDVWNLVVGETR